MRTANIYVLVYLLLFGSVTSSNALTIFDNVDYEPKPNLMVESGFLEPFLNYIAGFETFAILSTNFDGSSFLKTNLYPNLYKDRNDTFGELNFIVSKYSRSYYGLTSHMDGEGTFCQIEKPSVDTAPVPEPATMLLFGSGLAGLAGVGLRRRKK